MSTLVPIDFEYNSSKQSKLNLVCCALCYNGVNELFWIYNDSSEYLRLKNRLLEIRSIEGDKLVLLAYNVIAEARSFIALDLSPFLFNWVDQYLEYRNLTNHNHRFMYGKQIIKGKKKITSAPNKSKYQMTEEEKKRHNFSKPEHSMGAAAYKILGIAIDNDFKDEVRDLILECKDDYSEEERETILTYCASDIAHLLPMFHGMIKEYKRLLGARFSMTELKEEMFTRSRYAILSAYMEDLGYPVNVDNMREFAANVPAIIWECQNDINKNLGQPIFRYLDKKSRLAMRFSMDTKLVKDQITEWCNENNFKNWMLTDKGALSLSLDAFSKPISYRHEFPDGNFIAQMQRYLKLKQSLNGFSANTTKKTIFDSLGDDGRVRPYMGIYGAQSSRSQPSATSFIPLKSAWMRCLIEPPEGRAIVSIDYASQEFLLAALISGDKEMLNAYDSGDVYLAFGKAIGYIPKDGTKKQYKEERDNCKAVVLGLSYDMSEYGLSYDLSEKFNREVTKEEALEWINKHKRAYPTFWKWKDSVQRKYRTDKRLKLADGWTLWGDNSNFRSVGNVPIQGMGACIMRKAVELAYERGLKVIYTLHDALYIECDDLMPARSASVLCECMDQAFRFYFKGKDKENATCRLDVDIWGPRIEPEEGIIGYETEFEWEEQCAPYKMQTKYIDPRAVKEYEKFKRYLTVDTDECNEEEF